MTIEINTANLDAKTPLYSKYASQNQPQPAFIELDCWGNGILFADYSGEIGNAVPFYYWHGLAVRWYVPSEISGESLTAIFSDGDFLAACQRIIDGFEEHWDGSNHVGRYTEDAQEAVSTAEGIISSLAECVEVWSAENWLFTSCSLKEHWSEGTAAEAAENLEGYIEQNQMIDGSIEGALVTQAKSDFEYNPENLLPCHIEELLRQGEITQAEANEWTEEHGICN